MKNLDVTAARHIPAIEILPSLVEIRPTDSAEPAKRGLEAQQDRWHAVRVGLIDARLRLPRTPALRTDCVGPALAVEEPSSPRKVVSIHDP
ncbi:MAG TPA: hypothetical protein VEP48_02380 [Methylomirabilota bacterium]|nr:hypothetical protein [Methylomirabilota bacterium]